MTSILRASAAALAIAAAAPSVSFAWQSELDAIPAACRPDRLRDAAEEDRLSVTGSRVQPAYGSGVIARETARGDAVANLAAPQASPPPPPPPPPGMVGRPAPQPMPGDIDRERYPDVDSNPVALVSEQPVSTFSIDVDTASYAVVRRYLNDCTLPPSDAVRVEEMVNYFNYEYELPQSADTPFSIQTHVTPNPWNENTQLLHVGVQGYDIAPEERPRANLVFLIDVSGSMRAADKLPLAQRALRMLVETLDEDDTISIVVYAGAAGAVLPPTPASDSETILRAIDRLQAGGSTAGGEGLRLAYEFAEANFDPEAVNRVMLLTDGDFNVGVTSDERLEDFVARRRDSGIYLSVLGFGRGNYNDRMMQTIAQAGNGIAAYIDTEREARRLMVDEAVSSLFTIAEDVKIQVEFNPARVSEYRLIGYETRMLERADFNNDAVDAGEVGSGHAVTAIYEIAAPGSEGALVDPLRYGGETRPAPDLSGEFAFIRVRYKEPGGEESILIERPVSVDDEAERFDAAPDDVRFAIHAAGFAQALRGDPYLGASYDYAAILDGARDALGPDRYGYRSEFLELVNIARYAAEQEELKPGTPGVAPAR